MEKTSYKDHFKSLINSKISFSFSDMLMMLMVLFIIMTVSNGLHFNYLVKIIFYLTYIVVGIVMVRPLPLKTHFKYSVFLIITLGVACGTGVLGSLSFEFAVLFMFLWMIFLVLMNILGKLNIFLGLFGSFIYFVSLVFVWGNLFGLNLNSSPEYVFNCFIYATLIGAFAVSLETIPICILRFLQRDPIKGEKLASLFMPNVSFEEFIVNRNTILDVDSSDKTYSLINIGMSLLTSSFNLKDIQYDIGDNDRFKFKEFKEEVNKLQLEFADKIRSRDYHNFQLDLNNLEQFRRDLDNVHKQYVDLSSPEYLNFKKSVNNYCRIFNNLNKILKDELTITNVNIYKGDSSSLNLIKSSLSFDNIHIRYIIRFGVSASLSFIADVLSGNIIIYAATITSIFTTKPDMGLTIFVFFKRVLATIAAVVLSLIVGFIFVQLNLTNLFPLLLVFGLGMFFGFIRNHYAIGIFFVMFGVVFLQPVDYIVSQGLLRVFGTCVGALISLIVGLIILPYSQKSNLTKNLDKKITLTNEYMVNVLNLNEKEILNSQHKLVKANLSLDSGLDLISNRYKNIDSDMELYKELSSSLNQLHGNVMSLSNYIHRASNDFKFEKALPLFESYFKELKNLVLDEVDLQGNDMEDKFNYKKQTLLHQKKIKSFSDKFDELENIVEELEGKYTNKEDIVLLRYFKWIYEDMEVIYDIVKEGNYRETFNKYNKLL